MALLKGDSVDEKHCYNYQKPGRRPSSTKAESGAETDNFSSSGYDTCSLKSESPRPHEKTTPSESSALGKKHLEKIDKNRQIRQKKTN